MSKILVSAVVILLTAPVWAAYQTVTLSVPTMNCPVCPITVKKALIKVPGVSQVEVSLEKQLATVTYDDARTSVEALTRATKMRAIRPRHWRTRSERTGCRVDTDLPRMRARQDADHARRRLPVDV